MLRPGDPPSDLVVVIRAAPATAREVIDDLAEDALASGLAYAIRLLDVAGELRRDPAYARGGTPPLEEP